jgi:transposase-like protein
MRLNALQAGFAGQCVVRRYASRGNQKLNRVFKMSITKTKTSQKRKKHAPEYKARVVLEIISGRRSVAEIARADQIKDSMLYEWRNEALEKLPLLFTMDTPVQSQSERERELEQLIGQMAIENQALKKASQWLSTLSRRSERS